MPLEPLDDDELAMIFMCCHPGIPSESRLALTLKTVGGFSTDEIASAFLAKRTAIQQRIVRAKRRIKSRDLRFELPSADALKERLDSVLTVLYLMFNEGYNASHGDALVRHDLCGEAIRLCGLVLERPEMASPECHALMALLLLQASRLPARTTPSESMILLEHQDRERWDRVLVDRGLRHLDAAADGERLTPYHLQAGIAAEHATSRTWAETDWPRIVGYYDHLERRAPSPVVTLNRAVALAMVEGAAAGLEVLDRLDQALADYYLLHAVRAELLRRGDRRDEALAAYRRALALATYRPERSWLERRLEECGAEDLEAVEEAPPPT